MLALTSLTSGGRSVRIVRLRTEAMEIYMYILPEEDSTEPKHVAVKGASSNYIKIVVHSVFIVPQLHTQQDAEHLHENVVSGMKCVYV
jgi:hypothetical protein